MRASCWRKNCPSEDPHLSSFNTGKGKETVMKKKCTRNTVWNFSSCICDSSLLRPLSVFKILGSDQTPFWPCAPDTAALKVTSTYTIESMYNQTPFCSLAREPCFFFFFFSTTNCWPWKHTSAALRVASPLSIIKTVAGVAKWWAEMNNQSLNPFVWSRSVPASLFEPFLFQAVKLMRCVAEILMEGEVNRFQILISAARECQ